MIPFKMKPLAILQSPFL